MSKASLVFMGGGWRRVLDPGSAVGAKVAVDDLHDVFTLRLRPGAEIAQTQQTVRWLDAELRAGRCVGGWLSYEWGAALEGVTAPDATLASLPDAYLVSFQRRALQAVADEAQPQSKLTAVAAPESLLRQRGRFERQVEELRQLIAQGRLYQLNLTVAFETDAPVSASRGPLDSLLQRFMAPQPVPYGLAVDWGQGRLFGLSMERCLRLSDDGVASVRPIKGTRPRGSTARADAEASAALLGSDKERAENTMIVDMVRNDLARVSRAGGVSVTSLLEAVPYTTLWHLESEVRARLLDLNGSGELLTALLPPASVTGCPKVSAMHTIAAMEGRRRGAYCGAQGLWTPDRGVELAVAIRQVEVRDGQARVSVGAGIVADSVPNHEWRETCLKAQSALRGLAALPVTGSRVTAGSPLA